MSAQASYLTLQEASQLARCSAKTIQRAIRSGELAGYRPGSKRLVRDDELRAWIEGRRATPASPPSPRAARGAPRRPPGPGSVAALRALEAQR